MKNISVAWINYLVVEANCNQCKNGLQVNLSPPTAKSDILAHASECSKCGNTIAGAYKFNPVHTNNKKDLGYIGVIGFNVRDVLPCNFKLECDSCDTVSKVQNVQASLDSNVTCSKCGKLMRFKISKYQLTNSNWEGTDKTLINSKIKATANASLKKNRTQKIKAGQPLPDTGTCKHYKKS